MKKISFSFLLFLLFWGTNTITQYNNYKYSATLNGIENQWHQIILPTEIFTHVNSNFSDLRIIGVTKNNDTIEAPYLLTKSEDKTIVNKVDFKQINTVKNKLGSYFTFEIPSQKTINQVFLNFKSKNYNRKVWLEGSNNQQEWFTILANYRIVSIQNEFTDYEFNKLQFVSANYIYYRLFVPIEQNVELLSASLIEKIIEKGKSVAFDFEQTISNNKDEQTTQIDINLAQISPVSSIALNFSDTIDYYRNIEISYVYDSIKTEKAWIYQYKTLSKNVVSSIEKNEFVFESTLTKKIKIVLKNYDNTPLSIQSVSVSGYVYLLTARFSEPAKYSLVFGNPSAQLPSYDLNYFKENIPESASLLTLGEITPTKNPKNPTAALFENNAFLWGIMGIIILILGWFSLKMLHGIKQKVE